MIVSQFLSVTHYIKPLIKQFSFLTNVNVKLKTTYFVLDEHTYTSNGSAPTVIDAVVRTKYTDIISMGK